jgi:hypothetical protein
MAMIRQLGVPTVFVTLSAVETKWPELLVILKKVVDQVLIIEEEADDLPYTEKARLIQSDPVTCAKYFDTRFRHLKTTWKTSLGPFGDRIPKDYYVRTEFQHRGSPHVHMLLWLSETPTFLPNEEVTSVVDFIDSMISCRIISEEEDPQLYALALSRQVHSRTRTCYKKSLKRGDKKCRFNFPFFPMDETCILEPFPLTIRDNKELMNAYAKNYREIREYLDEHGDDLHNASTMTFVEFIRLFNLAKLDYINAIRSMLKVTKVFLTRSLNEVLVNNYNPGILKPHRANMDIQYIIDPYACCVYIVDYINKAIFSTILYSILSYSILVYSVSFLLFLFTNDKAILSTLLYSILVYPSLFSIILIILVYKVLTLYINIYTCHFYLARTHPHPKETYAI